MLTKEEVSKFRRVIKRKRNQQLIAILNALGESKRYQIFKIFTAMKKNYLRVGEVAQIFKISSAASSQHLKIMADTNLLTRKRAGQSVRYKLNRTNPATKVIRAIFEK